MSAKLEFQLYDWLEAQDKGKFIIHSFGRTESGKSVYAKITGFKPYFYFFLPDIIQDKSKEILDDIIKKIAKYFKSDIVIEDDTKTNDSLKFSFSEIQLVELKKAEGFTNDKKFWFAKVVFNNVFGMSKYTSYLEKNKILIPDIQELKIPIKYKLYETNLQPMLRCFHIKEISGCSWVETTNYKSITDEEKKESRCNIEIEVDYRNLNPTSKEHNAPFIICSFDIECYSIDGKFPQAERPEDKVIQIGATYTKLGESMPYRQYIGCLNDTAAIDNTIVESYKTEEELLLKFLEEIVNNDCDIITGYNILYFDEKYLNDRCKLIGIEEKMGFMSKLKKKCSFKVETFSNKFKYWDTPGRIHIDLMKEIQKDYKLTSYKLDYVASHFIRGEIFNFKLIDSCIIELECKEVNDIKLGDYIHLEVDKGYITDEIGEKYKVIILNINEKKITVEGNDSLLSKLKIAKLEGTIYWSQGKDDVSPKDIFNLFKGTPKDRAIIAKYCIKDCSLVNLLINKLEIVTKNIEMSNVCFVPLSNIFFRGQGIKIFSLCLKEFNIHGYVFPDLKMSKSYVCRKCNLTYLDSWMCPNCKSKDRDELELKSSFEGAIVFDPIPNVEYEAIVVKDYASLYPSSIIHKNMSHETIIEDRQYDNIDGITYYNSQFKDSDGSIKLIRFAKKEDKLGIIPTILNNLLKERKRIKKQMNEEQNPLKKKILDAKQLAFKVTANSVYGQLGSSFSQLYKRDLAACTTSTGREMLYLAKKYDEEYLPCIFNGLKYFYKTGQQHKVEHMLDLELKDRKNQDLIERIKKLLTVDIKNITFQPIIRYGDTDSIFSCYRFREKTELVPDADALVIWKHVVEFGKQLIIPYFGFTYQRILFTKIFDEYYSKHKITDLRLPKPIVILPVTSNNLIILSLEERIKHFVNEYMQESYIPLFSTLTELVEKNQTSMFDFKITHWIKQKFGKFGFELQDLTENRKIYLIYPLLRHVSTFFCDGEYVMPTDNDIVMFAQKFLLETTDSYLFANEIKKTPLEILEAVKKLLKHTIIINQQKKSDKKIELQKIIEDFIENDIGLIINRDKLNHFQKIIDFIKISMTTDSSVYEDSKYYWLHPIWDFDIEGNKIYRIDIHKGGNAITDKRTLEYGMEIGKLSGETIKSRLPYPHDCEYEKTFWPFIILGKKKYVGNKYEFDITKHKIDYTGIVIKRLGDAPIVKEICGGIIDQLINHKSPEGAKTFLHNSLNALLKGKYNIKYFIISQVLKSEGSYEDPTKIPHQVLSTKIAQREPGNTLQIGDRIEYAIVKHPTDIIETPKFIIENDLQIDYRYYILNYIMKPALQLLELVDKDAKNIFNKFINSPELNNKYYLIKEKNHELSFPNINDDYKQKYLKYKNKYLKLKSLIL
jgi:DNA polymerase elongation subunit (family B)